MILSNQKNMKENILQKDRPPQAVPDDGQQYDWNEDQYQSTGNGWVVRSE